MKKNSTPPPPGYKQTKIGVLPVEWDVVRIDDVSIVNPRKPKIKDDELIVFLGMTDISEEGNVVEQHKDKAINRSVGLTSFRKGDILIAKITPCFENMKGALLDDLKTEYGFGSTEFHVLRSNDKIDKRFLYAYTRLHDFRGKGESNMTGSAGQKRVPTDYIKSYKIPLPPLPEQQKIAQILSTWDDATRTLTQLIDAKKEQKRGLMQRLLTGEVRLPGFSSPEGTGGEGEWEVVSISEIGKTFNGLSGKTKGDFGEGEPFITYMNVFKNTFISPNMIGHVDLSDGRKQSELSKGDIIFTVSSETPHEVGMSSVFLHGAGYYLNSFCFGLRPFASANLDPRFSGYLFRGQEMRKKISQLAQGSTRFNLSKGNFMKLKVTLPPLPEQRAIAAVLTTADREITLLENQLAELKEQKRGLMQRLLTGQVRVNVATA